MLTRSAQRRLLACAGVLVLAATAVVGASCLGRSPENVALFDPGEFRRIEVSGALLLFRESPYRGEQGSVFAIMLAGRGDQGPGETHFAHIAEHQVFKNTVRASGVPDLISWVLERRGIVNGWTGFCHTQFELTVRSEDVPEAVGRLARDLFSPTKDASMYSFEMYQHLVPELEHMITDELSAPLNAFQMQMLAGTPYFEELFGVKVSNMLFRDVDAWRAREYCPERLMMVVEAKVDEQAVIDAFRGALAEAAERGLTQVQPEARNVTLTPPQSGELYLPKLEMPTYLAAAHYTVLCVIETPEG